MAELAGKFKVVKRNILNEIRSNNMTLQELRLFSIYLSKINPKDISTRNVRFPLDDFCRIMELGKDVNIPHFRMTIRRILQQIVEVPNEKGSGYTAFQLFKQAEVEKDEYGEWYVEFDAHDKALPLMFDFKRDFFQYQLWNALRLRSANQIRMYEILKQYEKIGKREVSVTELRELLGIGKEEYADRWNNFKTRVLDSCQQALKQYTDICYTYERGKAGRGGKWLTIVFHIFKNEDNDGQTVIDEFLPVPSVLAFDKIGTDGEFVGQTSLFETPADTDVQQDYGSDELNKYAEACGYSFAADELKMIEVALTAHTASPATIEERVTWLHELYADLKIEEYDKQRKGEKISNRIKYFVAMIQKSKPPKKEEQPSEPSYDMNAYSEMIYGFDPSMLKNDKGDNT